MSRNYKIRNQQKLHFVSFATVNWIDVFIRRAYKDIFVDSLSYCMQHKGLEVYAWCIMSSHVHLISGITGEKMEDILRDLKRHTSKTLPKPLLSITRKAEESGCCGCLSGPAEETPNNTKYPFWQQHNQPIELWSNELMDQKLQYLHRNPVKVGWVEEPEHYLYSSARDYAGVKGLVEVKLLE